MSLSRTELEEAARQAFGLEPGQPPLPNADAAWTGITEMGLLGATVPEARGGLGLGPEAAAVIHAEAGRALVPGPLAAQTAVIGVLAAAAPSAQGDALLARAMAGEVMTAPLMPGPSVAGPSVAGPSVPGGTLRAVPDADRASHVLVAGDDAVALVPLAGAAVRPFETWDRTRRLFDVEPAGEGVVLAHGAAAAGLRDRADALVLLALAGDSVGGATAILDLTVSFLGVRRQFGRPLAMFQALKHRVADIATRVAAADALYRARAADGRAALNALGAAKVAAAAAYRDAAEEAVQLHGGIGLTAEHHCHLFLKRATLNQALGGDADHWEERAGRALLAAG